MEAKIFALAQEVQQLAQECDKGNQNMALPEEALKWEGEEMRRLHDKLQAEGNQTMLLCGRLTQADRQQGELMPDRNVGLTNEMLLLKEKEEEMIRERVVPWKEREELQGDTNRLSGKLDQSKAT